MRISRKVLALAGVAAASMAGAPAFAHHSYAMFELQKNVTIEGTVKEFQWSNPHSFLQVVAKDSATGKDIEYSIEGGSPSAVARLGWTRHSAVPGDQAVVVIHPLKDGSAGGSLVTLTINGKKVGDKKPNLAQ